MRKVFIDTIIIKFEHTKLGIVQYEDTEVNGNVKNNSLFRFQRRNNHWEVQSSRKNVRP